MSDGEPRGFRICDVIDFCRRNDSRGLCFSGWPQNILEIYFRFHHNNGSLFLVERDGVLVGVGVGNRCNEDRLDRHWEPFDGEGDSFYVSDLICVSRGAVATLVDEFEARIPEWKELKLFAIRHGRKKQLKTELFERLYADIRASSEGQTVSG